MASNPLDYKALSAADRLRLIEEIWDSLSDTPESVPLTDAQREELDRRLDGLDSGAETKLLPWAEVREGLRRDRSK